MLCAEQVCCCRPSAKSFPFRGFGRQEKRHAWIETVVVDQSRFAGIGLVRVSSGEKRRSAVRWKGYDNRISGLGKAVSKQKIPWVLPMSCTDGRIAAEKEGCCCG